MNIRPLLLLSGMGLIAYGALNNSAFAPFGVTDIFDGGNNGTAGASMTSAAGRAAIQQNEGGFRARAYRDGTGYSIGFGHHITLFDALGPNSVITLDRGNTLFNSDIASAERTLNSAVDVPLSQGQFDSLVDFIFNRGSGNFAKSGIAAALNSGNLQQAVSLLQNFDNGSNLASRRAQNAATFLS